VVGAVTAFCRPGARNEYSAAVAALRALLRADSDTVLTSPSIPSLSLRKSVGDWVYVRFPALLDTRLLDDEFAARDSRTQQVRGQISAGSSDQIQIDAIPHKKGMS
jgi:hypothetical protein